MAKTSMTGTAREIFLAASPRVETRSELQRHCRNLTTGHTLGCFLVVQQCSGSRAQASDCSRSTQIHLLRIDRADLRDLIYVSASHELLHAVYEQLSPRDRRRVDAEVQSATARVDQCRLATKMDVYASRPAADRLNELHSMLGTEFAVVPAGLESHYSRYLANRQVVVRAYDRTLGGREAEICSLRANLDRLQAQIRALRPQLQSLRAAGDHRAYNAQVPRYNGLVSHHNRLVSRHNQKVREYNLMLAGLGSTADVLTPVDPARQ